MKKLSSVFGMLCSAHWTVIAIIVSIGLLYLPTFRILHEKWAYSTGAYSHGYLVLGLSALLLVHAAQSIRQPMGSTWIGFIGVIATGFGWLLAYLGNIMVIQAMMVPTVVLAALLSVFGIRSIKVWLFPIAYFLFAVPIWDYMNGALQAMTIGVSTAILTGLGITAYIDGSFVYLPSGTFEIAAGCSGLHFFVTAMALSSLYGYLSLASLRYRLLLFITGTVLSIVMNWIRVTTIIVSGYLTDMQHYLVTVDHYLFGWVLFAFMLVPLYLVALRFQQMETTDRPGRQRNHPEFEISNGVIAGRSIVAVLLASIAPFAVLAMDSIAGDESVPVANWPRQFSEWQLYGHNADLDVNFSGALTSSFAAYRKDKTAVTIFANSYGLQKQGAELISDSNRIFAPEIWRMTQGQIVEIRTGDAPFVVRAIDLERADARRRVIYYWFEVGGRPYHDKRSVKIAEVLQTLKGEPKSGLRLLSVDCLESCAQAHTNIRELIANHGKRINDVMAPGGN